MLIASDGEPEPGIAGVTAEGFEHRILSLGTLGVLRYRLVSQWSAVVSGGGVTKRKSKATEDYERLRLAIKALGGGVWDYDIDEDAMACGGRWYEILGLKEALTPIRSIGDFRPHIHPEDVQRATEVDLERVEQLLLNDEIYHVDFRVIRPNGDLRWIRSVACLIRDRASSHRHAIGCITDVTQLRQSGTAPVLTGEIVESAPNDLTAGSPKSKSNGEPSLTQRERECLMWVSLGKTATETGVLLGNSRRTVEYHLSNAIRKLQAQNKIHATAMAIRLGII